MVAGQNAQVDVRLCHTGDLVPSYTQAKQKEGPQHICVDVHSEDSVRKKNNIFVKITNIKFHENLSVGNTVTPYGKRNDFISPFEVLQKTHKIIFE